MLCVCTPVSAVYIVMVVPCLHDMDTVCASAWTCTFLCLLMLLAGDIEMSPGPRKGKEKAVAGQQL